MCWIYLILAILFEVTGTTFMKMSEGLTRTIPVILMFIMYIASIAALSLALKKIEVGIAYAIWSGTGTALITIIGIALFRESITSMKITGILIVIAGVTILNIAGSPH